MDYIISKEQFFDVLSHLIDVNYPRIKHTTKKGVMYIYYGKSLTKYTKKPTLLLTFYSKEAWNYPDELWISDFVYSRLKNYFPPVSDNLLFYDFFKEWFTDKFGIVPSKVYIQNQHSLNQKYESARQ